MMVNPSALTSLELGRLVEEGITGVTGSLRAWYLHQSFTILRRARSG